MKIFKYTKRSSAVNRKIHEQLIKIVEEIRKNLPCISIVLGGSFGLGEGSVGIRGRKIIPLNDYDIYAITEKPVKEEGVDEIATKASRKIGYKGISILHEYKKSEQKAGKNFYVDLECLTIKQLKKLLPRLRFYNLKNSLLLYGKDIKRYLPAYRLEDIPLSEGAKLLLDRMSQLSCYYSIKKYDKEFLTYIIQQAYSSCCTSLLLLSKKYKVGYYKNMKILLKTYEKDFPELAKKLPELDKRIKRFIEWRVRPDKLPEDPEKAWFECRQDILEVTKYFLSHFLKKKIKNLDELSKTILKMSRRYYFPYLKSRFGKIAIMAALPLNLYFKLKYFARMKNKKLGVFFNAKSPDMIIFAAVPYVLFGIEKNKRENKEMIKKAKELLCKIYPVKSKTWEELSREYAEAYFTFYLQKII